MSWRRFKDWLWRRRSPEERERRRRLDVNRHGRMVDATIIDFHDGVITYTYSVRGMAYTASQDVRALGDLLPPNPLSIVGPAAAKYHLSNPANSIVLCETWSGIPAKSNGATGTRESDTVNG